MVSEDPASNGLRITLKDLYVAQLETTRQLTESINSVKTAVDRLTGHLEVIDARNQNADKLHTDFESRIRSLEAFKWKVIGAVIGINGVGIAAEWIIYVHIHK